MAKTWGETRIREDIRRGYPTPPPYGLYSRIKFGDHRGKWISTIIEKDPGYIRWCLDNVKDFRLTREAEIELEMSER